MPELHYDTPIHDQLPRLSAPKIAVVGSREYRRLELVKAVIGQLARQYPEATVISGGARGVDTVAVEAALDHWLDTRVYPADWSLGRHAGMLRNRTIIEQADLVVAFWDLKSPGTRDTLRKARQRRLPIKLYGPDGYLLGDIDHYL